MRKLLILLLLVISLGSCATKKSSCDAYGLNYEKKIDKNLDSSKIVIIFDKV
jgi:ABC-type uncharacterized transport system auxiliary subunit